MQPNTPHPIAPPTDFIPKRITPTDEQKAIQASLEPVVIVQANAGAAKTTTLALRIAQAWSRGVYPSSILALTYTEVACRALKGALKKIGVPSFVVKQLRICTFEQLCTQVLGQIDGGSTPVFTEAEQFSPAYWQAINDVVANTPNEWRSDLLIPSLGDNSGIDAFLRMSEYLKGSLRDALERDDQAVTPDYAAALGVGYTQLRMFLAWETRRFTRPNDPDVRAEKPHFRSPWDASYEVARMLLHGESLRYYSDWPTTMRLILVDELHDVNHAMFTILQALLADNPCLLCAVGDKDQVIHTAAGADARYMDAAQYTSHPGTSYRLTPSFRFAKPLAKLAGALARKTYASQAPDSTAVDWVHYRDRTDCAHLLVQAAQQWGAEHHAKMGEFAVLLRHAHQSVEIENALISARIPYTTQGFGSYVRRPEVLLLRGLFIVANNDYGNTLGAQARQNTLRAWVLFAESKIVVEGSEKKSPQRLLEDAAHLVGANPSLLDGFFKNHVLRHAPKANKHRLEDAVQLFRTHSGPDVLAQVVAVLNDNNPDVQHRHPGPGLMRRALASQKHVDEASKNLEWLAQAARAFPHPQAFFEHLYTLEQVQAQDAQSASAGLLLASIASVKGLEFDAVCVPYLEKGEFPADQGEAQEEANSFYVAITRARRKLTLYSHQDHPSRFTTTLAYPQ